MEDFYWFGYSIAFILEIILTIYGLIVLNSIKAKNFEKVWLFYSLHQLTYAEWNKPWILQQASGILLRFLINPFFSWLDIWWHIIRLGVIINQKLSTPEKAKEIQYKLWTTLLNKEEVKSLIKQSVNYLWKNIEFEDDKFIIDDDNDGYGWYADVTVDTVNKKLIFYSHSPDYDQYYNTYLYKIEGDSIYTKLLERRIKNIWNEEGYFDVRDGIVLENDFIERHNESASIILWSVEERLSELKKELEWSDDLNYKVKYFVLSKHPEIINIAEFKKICRSEIERLKKGHKKHKEIYAKYNIEIRYNEEDSKYEYDYKEDEVDLDALRDELENALEKIHCTSDEVSEYSYNERIALLESYLSEES